MVGGAGEKMRSRLRIVSLWDDRIEEEMREEIEGKKRKGEGRRLGNLRKVMKT